MEYDILSSFKGKRIAIVGRGYIGKNLFQCLDRFSSEFDYTVETFGRDNLESIKNKVFDYVFNCAGNTGDFRTKFWSTIDSNLILTKYLLENVEILDCYVALSSTRLYGFSENKNILFDESSDCIKHSDHLLVDFVYDGTKMLLESVLLNLSKTAKFNISVCRLSNLFGRYTMLDLNDSTYIKFLVRAKLEGKSIDVNQNISNTKGYIFVDDAILGIIRSALYAKKSDIYNICSGESYSIKDWLIYLGLTSNVVDNESCSVHSKISIGKAASELHFRPQNFLNNIDFNKIFINESYRTI